MNRPGWNPIRRNRNLGTPKAGHSSDNFLTIPTTWVRDVIYDPYSEGPWARVVTLDSAGGPLQLVVERPRSGYTHPCTPEDIEEVLQRIPPADIAELRAIVLRQPTKKESILRPVWGSICFNDSVRGREGPAIYLDAQQSPLEIRWGRKLLPGDEQELDRLRAAGFSVESSRRSFTITGTHDAVRRTVLFHTLPHEIGHLVDYQRFLATQVPAGEETERERFRRWFSRRRPLKEKEEFADRYATELYRRWFAHGGLDPSSTVESIRARGLDPNWFGRFST